ncbi:MAG: prepilin-type N-terminal cleavage/methylation domain-containing protein [Betaproteobacteria bacterium]|nr:prepilin-type N-terminal cleavage/methylation domain-containing protein [Betaproteobacteria bacterium]
MSTDRRQSGVSLLELILGIVVVSVALTGAMALFFVTVRGSVDPMTRQQAQLIAEAYLEEILLKKFYDPDTSTVCTSTKEGSRSAYDNVCDYNGLVEAPHDQFGNAIAALSSYSVSVTVTADGTVSLNGLNNASVVNVMRVDVAVTGPNNASATLSGYRTNYNCNASGDPGCKSF